MNEPIFLIKTPPGMMLTEVSIYCDESSWWKRLIIKLLNTQLFTVYWTEAPEAERYHALLGYRGDSGDD